MSEQKIEFYKGAAGGWGALRSVSQALMRQDIAVKGAKTLLSANQPDGFDCPGCAWPDRNHHSTFEFCENGAKAVAAEETKFRAGPELFAKYTVTQLAEYSDYWLEQQGRLTTPMRYDAATDHYVPVTWDEALGLVAPGKGRHRLDRPARVGVQIQRAAVLPPVARQHGQRLDAQLGVQAGAHGGKSCQRRSSPLKARRTRADDG